VADVSSIGVIVTGTFGASLRNSAAVSWVKTCV
jgi:hypothetical protein